MAIRLIVNADDFGFSRGITDGIIYSHQHGLVRSTSLMVNAPAASYAAKQARKVPKLSIGLHFVLEASSYPLAGAELVELLLEQLTAQYQRFITLMGYKPQHLDVHQVIPKHPALMFALQAFITQHQLFTRLNDNINTIHGFYGLKKFKDTTKDLSVAALSKILNSLTAEKRNLLVCHPGFSNRKLKDPYNFERRIEVATLTSPEILSLIEKRGVILEPLGSKS